VIGSVFLVGEHFIHDLAVAPIRISVCSCRFEDGDQDSTDVDQPGFEGSRSFPRQLARWGCVDMTTRNDL
jgi:hypothetical protein